MLQFRVLPKLRKSRTDVGKIDIWRMQIDDTTFNLNAYSEHDVRLLLVTSLATGSNPLANYWIMKRVDQYREDLRRVSLRRMRISTTYFNLNRFSERETLSLFRFRLSDIPHMAQIMSWLGLSTKQCRCICDSIILCWIILHKCPSPCDIAWPCAARCALLPAPAFCRSRINFDICRPNQYIIIVSFQTFHWCRSASRKAISIRIEGVETLISNRFLSNDIYKCSEKEN